MITDIHDFTNAFKTEDELRRALIRLFSNIPSVRNIRHIHGPNELGKDIVFDTTDALGDTQITACVVKNEKISGSADTGARVVVTQAQQALDTEFIDEKGNPAFVDQVYIISPFEVSQTTMNSVKGAMGPTRGRVTFKCGLKLLALFREHLSEYLLLQSNILGSYVTRLLAQVDQESAVANLLLQHGLVQSMQKRLRQVYVPPALEVTLRRFQVKVTFPNLAALEELVSFSEISVISGQLEHVAQTFAVETTLQSECSLKEPDILKLKRLSERLVDEWNDQYARLRKSELEEGKRPTAKDSVRLRIPSWPKWATECKAQLQSAREIVQRLKEQIDHGNSYSKDANGESALLSPNYRDYSIAELVSRSVPRLVPSSGAPHRFELPQEFIRQTNLPVLITAPAGFGKSSFCRANALQDAEDLVAGGKKTIPVLIPLYTLAARSGTEFEGMFLADQQIRTILEQDTEFIVRVYLDGLDEIPLEEKQRELMLLAEQGWQKYSNKLSIVITGREHVSGSWLSWLRRIRIAEFTDAQVRALAEKWLDGASDVALFFDELNRAEQLRAILRTPLLCTLTLSLFRVLRRLPENRVKLYEMFVSLLCGGWDAAKGVNRGSIFGPQPKLQVAQMLAATLHQSDRIEINSTDLKVAIEKSMPNLRSKQHELLSELVEDGLLVPVGERYIFAHLSFQEFLAAKDLVQPTGQRATAALSRFLSGQDWWRGVVGFYVEMMSRPEEAIAWINDTAESVYKKVGIGNVAPRQMSLIGTLQNLRQPGESRTSR